LLDFWIAWTCCLAVASAGWPLWQALRAARGTTLLPTVTWLIGSWLAWLGVAMCLLLSWPLWPVMQIALALTACAGVSVLGARRPGFGAWSFVTLGLLAVLLLPLLEQPWSAPHWSVDAPRSIFLGLVLAVGLLNYAPTRWGPTAALTAGPLGFAVWALAAPPAREEVPMAVWALALSALVISVWTTWALLRKHRLAGNPIDQLWSSFRDRYGLAWAKRVQEQFNQAASHAGCRERLTWRGMTASELSGERQAELFELLQAVLKRFGLEQQVST
jgi:hypothetical protein